MPPVPDANEDADVLALVEGSRLTAKQRRFCWEFLHGETAGNAMRSYVVAYGNPNEKTAGPAADLLLKDSNVQKYLDTLRQQALARRGAEASALG
jgi:phage terminase small subunit